MHFFVFSKYDTLKCIEECGVESDTLTLEYDNRETITFTINIYSNLYIRILHISDIICLKLLCFTINNNKVINKSISSFNIFNCNTTLKL